MAKYLLNEAGVIKARTLIDARRYVLDRDWGDVQPRADAQNGFLANHSWEEYADWHIELAAHDLLQYLDAKTGLHPTTASR
ncbi:MAG: hypothetical protein ACRDU5_20940 [Mycobacterium sp.]